MALIDDINQAISNAGGAYYDATYFDPLLKNKTNPFHSLLEIEAELECK